MPQKILWNQHAKIDEAFSHAHEIITYKNDAY